MYFIPSFFSGETARGLYPVEATAMMSSICGVAEGAFGHWPFFLSLSELLADARRRKTQGLNRALLAAPPPSSPTAAAAELAPLTPTSSLVSLLPSVLTDQEALAVAAVHASFDVHAALIVVVSRTGRTARFIAKYRPAAPIIALAYNAATCRRVQLLRGVQAVLFDKPGVLVHDVVDRGVEIGRELGLVKPGDTVVVVCGEDVGAASPPNAGADAPSPSTQATGGGGGSSMMRVSLLHVK